MICGEIKLDWRDRHAALGKNPNIPAALGDARWQIPGCPVIWFAPGIHALVKPVMVNPQPLAGNADTLHLLIRQVRYIDVKEHFR